MDTFFGPDFFTANRERLRMQLSSDIPIVIAGNGHMQKSGDEPFKFTQDSNFWYLSGLNGPDLALVIGRKDTYLIVPTLSFEREAFDGAHDIAVATLAPMPSYMKRHGLYTLPFRRRLTAKLKRLNPAIALQDIRLELAQLRSIKQPEELAAMQKAIDITTATLQEIASHDALSNVRTEYQLEAALSYSFRMRGANGHAFAPVIGAGKHSTTLHHVENNGAVNPQDLIVVDVGAEVEHYASDIARTISQQPITGRAADVFRAVMTVQDFAISQVKRGVLPFDYEKAVQAFMGEQLQKLGIITGNSSKEIRRYFPHATSHFIGLDTHDAGDYRQPYQENMVISCEPGIYLPEEGIGIRIEDDLLITSDGCQVLSASCPRELSLVHEYYSPWIHLPFHLAMVCLFFGTLDCRRAAQRQCFIWQSRKRRYPGRTPARYH
jgi:Xaa-Pro aminopeptidase